MIECLFLIGPRGSGKSTVARLLAGRLGWDWVDADVELERRAGRSIREIFAEEGEHSFRDRESAVLADLAGRTRAVIATGGGVVLREQNRALLRTGKVVWLTASVEVLWARLQGDASTGSRRPDLAGGGRDEIAEVLRHRESIYRECAGLTVDTAGATPDEVVERVAAWLQEGG